MFCLQDNPCFFVQWRLLMLPVLVTVLLSTPSNSEDLMLDALSYPYLLAFRYRLDYVYLLCEPEKAVILIPFELLKNFNETNDLVSIKFATDAGCDVEVYRHPALKGIEIRTFYNDSCGSGLEWKGSSLFYQFPKSFSYVNNGNITYHMSYKCEFESHNPKFLQILANQVNFTYPPAVTRENCSSFTNTFLIPPVGRLKLRIHFAANANVSFTKVHVGRLSNETIAEFDIDTPAWSYVVPSSMKLNPSSAGFDSPSAKGVLITTDAGFQAVAFGSSISTGKMATFAVLPLCALGTDYVITSYPSRRSFVVLTSIHANTTLQITLTNGDVINATLNKSSSVHLVAGRDVCKGIPDISGTHVTSSQPISVVTVMLDAKVPYDSFEDITQDFMAEQLLPVSLWDTEYVINPESKHGFVIRIVSYLSVATVVQVSQGFQMQYVTIERLSYADVPVQDNYPIQLISDEIFLPMVLGTSGINNAYTGVPHVYFPFGRVAVSRVVHTPTQYPYMMTVPGTSSYAGVQSFSSFSDKWHYHLSFVTDQPEDFRIFGLPTTENSWMPVTANTEIKASDDIFFDRRRLNVYYGGNQSTFGSQVITFGGVSTAGHCGAMVYRHLNITSSGSSMDEEIPTTKISTTAEATTEAATTEEATTEAATTTTTTTTTTTEAATTEAATTEAATTEAATTEAATTEAATTEAATTEATTTEAATTEAATTKAATTETPTTEAPTTEAPTTESATTESATTESATTESATTESATTEAATTEAATTESATTESATTESATTESATTESATTESATTESATTESATTEAPTTEAPTTEAPTTESATTESATTESATTESATTESATTEAATTESATTEAATTEAATTEAATTEAATTEAATTEAATTEAASTEAATTEAVTTWAEATTASNICSECLNGGTCSGNPSNFICECANGFAGARCEEEVTGEPGNYIVQSSNDLEGLFMGTGNMVTFRKRATSSLMLQVIKLGQYSAIRSTRDCPSGAKCNLWLNVLKDKSVFLMDLKYGYHPWHFIVMDASQQSYILRSAITGGTLAFENGFVLSSDSAATPVVFLLTLIPGQSNPIPTEELIIYNRYEVQRQDVVTMTSYLSVPVASCASAVSSPDKMTTCVWFRPHLTSPVMFPTVVTYVDGREMYVCETDLNGLKVLNVTIDNTTLVAISQPFNANSVSRGYWHHACIRMANDTGSGSFDYFLDGFRITFNVTVSTMELDAFFEQYTNAMTVKLAYCSPDTNSSCFAGYISKGFVWQKFLTDSEIYSVYSAPFACGLGDESTLLGCDDEIIGNNILLQNVELPFCPCKFCEFGWTLAGQFCYQSSLLETFTFESYYRGEVCNGSTPAVLSKTSRKLLVSSMVDATHGTEPYPWVGLFRKQLEDSYLWYNNETMEAVRPSGFDICGHYEVTNSSIMVLEYWQSVTPGAVLRPRQVDILDGVCSEQRPVLCEQEADDFPLSKPVKVIFVVAKIANTTSWADFRLALNLMVSLVRAQNVTFTFEANPLPQESFTDRDGARQYIDQSQFETLPTFQFAETFYQASVDRVLPLIDPNYRTFVVLTTSISPNITSEVETLRNALAGVGSVFAFGFNDTSLTYLETLATHSDFAWYTSDIWNYETLTSPFRKFLCGVKEAQVNSTYAVTTEAVTTKAVTTEAVTTEAVTTEAATTEAATTEAVTTEAVTTEASTTEAATTEAATTEAVTTEAATTETVTTEAATTEAATTEAATTEAATTEAATTEDATTEAATTETEAATTETVTTEAATTEAATTEAATTEAATTEAATTEAATTEAATTEAATTETVTTETVTTEVATTEAATTEAATTEAATTEAATTEAATTEAATTEAATTEAATTEAATTEAATTEAATTEAATTEAATTEAATTEAVTSAATSTIVQCDERGMTVNVETSVVESSLVLTNNTTKIVFFSGYSDSENCSSSTTVQNTAGIDVYRLFVPIPFDDCGIAVNLTTDDIYVEGQIYADLFNRSMLLSFAVPIYNVSCTYGANFSMSLKNETVSRGLLPFVNQSNVAKISGAGTFKVELTLYPDATLSNPLPNLPTVSVGTAVFVVVNSTIDLPVDMRIFVDRCVASSENTYNPTDPNDVVLIEDNCLKHNIPSWMNVVTDDSTVFSFMVFHWLTPGDDYIYIHCVASLCLITDPACRQSCTDKRRKRRAPVELETSIASIKIHLVDPVTKIQNTTTVTPDFNSTHILPGFCRHPYQIAGLILFTFLFLLTVVVAVIYTSRHIGFHAIAKHTSSQYCKGSSVSDIHPPVVRPSFFTDAENNNGPTTSQEAVVKSAMSALAVGTSVVPAATESHRTALMQEIGRVQTTRLSQVSGSVAPPKVRSGPGTKRPFSTFLGSSSESNYESEVIPLTKSKTLPGYKTGQASVNAKAAARIHFEGISVDQTAM